MSLIETDRNHSGLFICLGVYSLNQLYQQGQICGPVCSLFLRMIADLTVLHQHSCLPGLVLFCRAISYSAEFSQSPSWAGRPMMSRTDGSTSVLVTASLGSYKSLWRIQLLHCLEGQRWWLRITFWAGSEISWWSQSWALEERNKCQRCNSTSTADVPGSRRNASVDSSDACFFWLWQRWGLRRQRIMTVFVVWLLWSYFHFEINKNGTFTVTKKGRLAPKLFFSSLSLNVYVYFFPRNTAFVPSVSQLNKEEWSFIGVFPPWGSATDVFQLQLMFCVPWCPCWVTT